MLRTRLLLGASILAVLCMAMPAAADDWTETWKIDADDAQSNARYGLITAVDGNIALVGAHQSDGNQGKAYLVDVTTGLQIAEIPPPSPQGNAFFGYSVDIDGNTAVIGEARRDGWLGAAHIFDISTPSAPVLVASHTNPEATGNAYGHDVAVSGNNVVIGSRSNDKAHLYDATTGVQVGTFTSPGAPQDFGNMVSIYGNTAAISDPDAKEVHLFDVSTPASPVAGAVLLGSSSGFGFGNDQHGNMLILGEIGHNGSRGLAHLYDVSDITSPVEVATLTPSVEPTPNEYWNFGYSVGISEDTAIVGRRDNYAFLYDLQGNELQVLTASDASPGFGGQGVSIDGGVAVVGAEGADGLDVDENTVSQSGAVFVFTAPAAAWSWQGATGLWSDPGNDNWTDGTDPDLAPVADTAMVIDADSADSVVTVAADFITGGTGPAGSVAIGENNAASLIVNSGVTLEVTEAVTVGGSGTLQVDGTLNAGSLAPAEGSTLAGSGTIAAAGEVMIAGTIAPGNSTGVLSLDVSAGAELDDSATYRCEIGADDAPIANDAINVTAGDLALGGTLELVATSKLRGPDESGEWFGKQTRSIVTAEGDSSVLYNFATPPTPLPVDFGAAEWGEGHIGRGVFLTRDNNGGENDAPGVSYAIDGTDVHLFQAIDGDTNGNAILDTADIFSILGAGSFLKPGEWDWTEGDFDGDKDVDTTDIFAILATGKWGNFDPYYPEPGKAAAAKGEADAAVDLIVNAKTGEVSVDTNGAEITGYVISSDSGALTGSAATQFALSEQTSDQIADMLPLGKGFAGVHDLGSVLDGNGSDLTLTYTLAGQSGVFKGNVQVVPEPSTLAMLLGTGLLGLLLALRRRNA